MELFLSGFSYRYECENLCRLFFPYSPVKVEAWDQPGPPSPGEGPWAWAVIEGGPGAYSYQVTVSDGERALTRQAGAPALEEYSMTDLLYNAFVELTGNHPAWGMLTGIHPVKLLRQYVEERGEEKGLAHFQGHCYVTPPKAELAHRVLRAQGPAVEALRENDFSLYVSIPFCPTRCAYCSFVSTDVQRSLKLVEPYLAALDREIDAVAEYLPQAGARVRTIYIGGGTPTTLSAGQLEHLISHLRRRLDLSRLVEFTVEAGRPDTITAEKMAVLRDMGVDRVSVNPQSMRDEVLKAMGRSHTAADILNAYEIVRRSGIPIVNMDLIAGLPRDTAAGFRSTLDQVIALKPENITVHTLALKKGARLMMEREGLPSGEETAAMLDYAWQALADAGQIPYYLYRQKYMSGALENIGWCSPGTEGLYNICIMEELHSILALGAGGSTKLTDPATGKIVRITNPKYPQQYLERIDELCRAKAELVPFQRGL